MNTATKPAFVSIPEVRKQLTEYKFLQEQVEWRLECIDATYVICSTPNEFCELDDRRRESVQQLNLIKDRVANCATELKQLIASVVIPGGVS